MGTPPPKSQSLTNLQAVCRQTRIVVAANFVAVGTPGCAMKSWQLARNTALSCTCRVVLEDSPLAYHLHPADVITRVDHCQVRNGAEWLGCMAQLPGVRDDSILSDFDGSVTANHLLEIMGHPATKPGRLSGVPLARVIGRATLSSVEERSVQTLDSRLGVAW